MFHDLKFQYGFMSIRCFERDENSFNVSIHISISTKLDLEHHKQVIFLLLFAILIDIDCAEVCSG